MEEVFYKVILSHSFFLLVPLHILGFIFNKSRNPVFSFSLEFHFHLISDLKYFKKTFNSLLKYYVYYFILFLMNFPHYHFLVLHLFITRFHHYLLRNYYFKFLNCFGYLFCYFVVVIIIQNFRFFIFYLIFNFLTIRLLQLVLTVLFMYYFLR